MGVEVEARKAKEAGFLQLVGVVFGGRGSSNVSSSLSHAIVVNRENVALNSI